MAYFMEVMNDFDAVVRKLSNTNIFWAEKSERIWASHVSIGSAPYLDGSANFEDTEEVSQNFKKFFRSYNFYLGDWKKSD